MRAIREIALWIIVLALVWRESSHTINYDFITVNQYTRDWNEHENRLEVLRDCIADRLTVESCRSNFELAWKPHN